MTKKEIQTKLTEIADNEDDPGLKGVLQKELYEEFIQHVANQGGDLGLMANMVLLTIDINK